METTITKHERDEFGNFIAHVRIDGVARKGIVPGYPGCEYVTVVVLDDGRAHCTAWTFGKHGYRCDTKAVRGAAIRAARSEAKRREAQT